MKKLVLTAAVLGFAASMASAQVYSQNIVGYSTDVSAPGLHISGFQFYNGVGDVESVYGESLPVGTKIWSYNGAGYDTSIFEEQIDWNAWPPVTNSVWNPATLPLDNASAYWVDNPADVTVTSIVSGEVPLDDAITNMIVGGLQLVSYPYPVAITSADQLGFDPYVGDKIWKFNGVGYDTTVYEEQIDWNAWPPVTNTVWNPAEFSVGIGEGFWYDAAGDSVWVADRPFTP